MLKIIGLFSLVLFASCESVPADECILRPLTKNEQTIRDSLASIYPDVEFVRWNNPVCDWMNDGDYQVFIHKIKTEDLMKFEEIDRQAHDLAVQFYTKIIEDSIIYRMPYIEFTFESIQTDISSPPFCSYKILKKDLESYCGFEIVKKPDNQFSRTKIEKTTDSLAIEIVRVIK